MNYYKVLCEDEKHRKMKYKTGLNVDVLKWYPHGDCTPGGIYFSREDIFEFFSYGPWIRKVTIPKKTAIYKNPGGRDKWKSHQVILGKRRKICTKVIKSLIKEGATVRYTILEWAVIHGCPSLISFLIPNFSTRDIMDALDTAVDNNIAKSAKVLIPLVSKKYCKKLVVKFDMNYKDCKLSKNMLKLFEPYLKKKRYQ